MMSDFLKLDDMQLKALRGQFVDQALGEELFDDTHDAAAPRISPSELYDHACARRLPDERFAVSLKAHPHLRALYHRMLAANSSFVFDEARAASAGDIVRNAPGCRIRMEKSQAEDAQVYVVIEFEADDPDVSSLVIVDSAEQPFSFDLPPTRRRICQLIAEEGDKLLQLLHDPKSRLYMR